MAQELLPRPATSGYIHCPSCGHKVDRHNFAGCELSDANHDPWCRCQWTPNDIAWHAVYGGLTSTLGTDYRGRAASLVVEPGASDV